MQPFASRKTQTLASSTLKIVRQTMQEGARTIANDVHSKLNSTNHREIIQVKSGQHVQALLSQYKDYSFSIAGGRHSMGGQQFLTNGILLDTSQFNRIVDFDQDSGLLTVQSGMLWGDLVDALGKLNQQYKCHWSIIQKPTGADDISIGGSLAANIHGRVLGRKPFIADIERFTAIMADGTRSIISRESNAELFTLTVGGYGLFCFVEEITIRLTKSTPLVRKVELSVSENLIERFSQLQKEGATYGDFQFCIDSGADTFLTIGILSVYFPITVNQDQAHTICNTSNLKLSEESWRELLRLAHIDKQKAFTTYSDHYKRTNGQIYASDTFQLSQYVPDYHDWLEDTCQSSNAKGSEMITELYIPKHKLHEFLETSKAALKSQSADVIYGTVRLIEKDEESFLAWAREEYACVIFNLHVDHNQVSLLRSKHSFRTLIDIALSMGGSYYLTYHHYASRKQLIQAYPQFKSFVDKKIHYDPQGRFRSNWFKRLCLSLEAA
ncbi:MAG: FAD-binding oxidoreductase [Candidatus Melainabacteria bacterium]|nr:FAD-binding oxidoreductase [Candidatus Melainabacteria bacterium]